MRGRVSVFGFVARRGGRVADTGLAHAKVTATGLTNRTRWRRGEEDDAVLQDGGLTRVSCATCSGLQQD